jgi:hypothetical protein
MKLIRVVQTSYQARPMRTLTHAERFVSSIKHECLNRAIQFGVRHLRLTIAEFVAHYHGGRNYQGLGNELIDRTPPINGPISGCFGFAGGSLLGAPQLLDSAEDWDILTTAHPTGLLIGPDAATQLS